MINDVINFLPDNFHICLMTVFFLPKQSRLICEVQLDRWSFNPYYITQSARSAIRDLMDGSLILGIDFNPTGFLKLLNLNDPQAAEEQDCHNKLSAS